MLKDKCCGEKSWREEEHIAVLHREVLAGLSGKARLQQNFEGGEWVSQADIWEKKRKRSGFTVKLSKLKFQDP